MLLLVSCGSSYNTDYNPPDENASFEDVFPAEIDGMEAEVELLQDNDDAIIVQSTYDGNITITVIQFEDKANADAYFKSDIVPKFDDMNSRSSGKVNGRWFAKGKDSDGRKAYAWVNNNWIFSIAGDNENYFDEAIDAFNFISK